MKDYYMCHMTSEDELEIETYAVVEAEGYGQAEQIAYCLPWEDMKWNFIGETSKILSDKLRDAHFKDFDGDNDCQCIYKMNDIKEIGDLEIIRRVFRNKCCYDFEVAYRKAKECYGDEFEEGDE